MNDKIKKGLSYFSLFILALGMLPLGNILADEKVVPTKFVIEQNNLEANGFKIANDQVLTSEDVVKLSNVKSIDNLVDVNTLSVSNDQLANVNQANPDGGLYNLTLTNGQKANITIPVVKEGSLTTTNSKGALIFKNLALSQEANSKEKVLEETGVYSVAFNNGYVNSDLTVDINKNSTVVKDTNLGLSKEIPNNMSSQEGHNIIESSEGGDTRSVPSTLSKSKAEARTNVSAGIATAEATLESQMAAGEQINVTSFEQIKSRFATVRDNDNVVFNITSNINWSQELVLHNKNNVTITFVGKGGMINFTAHGIGINTQGGNNNTWNFKDITIKGVMEDRYATIAAAPPVAQAQWMYMYNQKSSEINLFGNTEISNIYSPSRFGACFEVKNSNYSRQGNVISGLQSINFYGGKYHHNRADVGSVVHTSSSELNIFDVDMYNNLNTWQGTIDQWEDTLTTANFFGGTVRDGVTSSGGYAFSVIENPLSRDSNWTAVKTPDGDSIGGTKVYGGFSAKGSTQIDSKDNIIRNNANFSIHGWDSSVSAYVDNQSLNQAYFNPLMEMTPQSNVYIGCHSQQNLDPQFSNYVNRDKYNKQVNGIILARLDYESNSPNKKYQGNGVAEGVHVDWTTNDPAHSNITSDGKYSVVEKYVRDLDSGPVDRSGYYAVLVRTYTDVEVQAVDANGTSIENGKYNYTSTVAINTQNKMSIPTINDKYPVSIELVSNTQTQGNDNSAHNPEITPANPDRNATEFTLKDNNNPSGASGNVYKTVIRIKYNDVQHNSIDAHDAYVMKSDVLSLSASTIDTYIKKVMGVRVTNIDNGSVIGNENVQVSYADGDRDKILSGTIGDYQITFNLDNVAVTKTLHVIEDGAEITPDNRGWVNAQNARIASQTAKVLNNENDLVGIINARGMYDGQEATISGTPKLSISTDQFSNIKLGKTGFYTVKAIMDGDGNFNTTDDQAVKQVILTVFDPASVIPTPDGQGSITAQNTVLTASEAKQLVTSDDSLKDIMKARAEYNGKTVDVKVNSNSQLSDIKAGKVNTNGYAIIFSMDADNNPQTVMDNQVITKKLYVVPDGSQITDDKKGFISAEEIWYRSADAIENFKEDKYIYSNMYGLAVYDGQTLDYDGTRVALTSATLNEIKQGAIKDHDVQFNLNVAGQTKNLTKQLHILPNSYVVTPDRFGYIGGLKTKAYSPIDAKNAYAGKQPNELLTTYGIHGYYKGVDKTSELSVVSPNWTNIKNGEINASGFDSSIKLSGKVEGTNLDDVTLNIKTHIYELKTFTNERKIGEFPTPVIGSIEHNPGPAILPPGDDGGINALDTILTVDQAKQVRSLEDLGRLAQPVGHAVGPDGSLVITGSTVSFYDPNKDEILRNIQSGKPGTYVMWLYGQYPGNTQIWGTWVRFVVVNNNTKTNAKRPRDQITWAAIDPETTIKDIDVQGQNFTDITSVANRMNAVAANHKLKRQDGPAREYYQEFTLVNNPDLTFVDANGTPVNQEDTLAAIKAGKVGDYYVKISNVKSSDPFRVGNGREIEYEVTAEATGKLSIVATDSIINAENFVVTTDEAKILTEAQAKTKANVSAQRDGHDITSQVTANQDQLDAIKQVGTNGEAGVFPLTFEVNGVRKTIQVSVVNDDTKVDPTNSLFLHAVGFEMPLDQAASLTEAQAKTNANVRAWNKDGANLNGQVTIKSGLAEIQRATEPGAYELVFTVTDNGKIVDKRVVVSLTDANTVCNGDVCIAASNFKYEFDKKAELTDQKQIQEAHAKAWNKKTGAKENITLTGSDAVRTAQKAGPYTVTATAKTASKPFIVSLYDANTSFDDNHFLRAENVSMPLVDASGLTDQRIKELAKVKAWEAQTGNDVTNDVTVDQAQLGAIKAATKPGAYPLTFRIGNVNKPIVVSLTDASTVCNGNVCIAANSFTQNLTDVAQLDEAEAIKKAGATAWYKDSVDTKPTVKVNQEQLAKIQNTKVADVFQLTFTTVENPNASKEVNVTVTDNNFELTANNFTIDLVKAKNYTDAQLIKDTAAKAVRKDNSGNGTVVVKDGLDAINQATKVGLFPVTLSVKEDPNTTKQVFITVTDGNTVVGDKAAITAKNFKLKLNAETASLTADTAKAKAEADAWYLDGHTPKPTINVDEAQLNAIKAAKEVGVMDLTFTVADDAKATRTVKVSIYDDNTVISPDESKFLHAKNFTITDEEAKVLTETTAKDKAGVKAWNADGTDLTPNVKVDASQLAKINEGVAGVYPLKFTVDGLEKTVNVNVKDGNTICGVNVCLTAKNFKLKLNTETASLTADAAKTKAEADAWYLDGHTPKPTINVDEAQLNAIKAAKEVGVMDLTFTVADDAKATRTVKVSIYDDNTVISPDESKFLHAKNFTITDEEAKVLTETTAKDKAGVKAWNADGTDLTPNVKVDASQLAKINEGVAGVYPLKFTVDGLEKTVNVNVKDGNTICGVNVCLTAKNFKLKLNTETASLTADAAKTKAEADAWYLDGHTPKPTINVDEAQLNAIKAAKEVGVVDLTFTVADVTKATGTVARTVKVSIYDDNTTIVLPGLDNKPGTPDDVVVKPKPDQNGNYPKPNPDGSVNLPGGGEITIPGTGNDDITIAPPASSIKPDGTVTTPSGNEVRPRPEGGVELPGLDGSITNKPQDNPFVKPNGNGPITINPDGSVTLPPNENGTITFPNNPDNNGVTNFPGGSTIKPDGTITTPNGNEVRPRPEGGVELPGLDGSITNKPQDNPFVKPNGNGPITVNPDGSVTLPPNENGTITFPNNPDNNGVTNFPGGSTIKPDGTITTPSGNEVRPRPEGGVELPGLDGSITNKPQDNPFVKPNGNGPITVNPDGSVTLPNDQNGTVTFPNNPDNNNEITIPNGSNIAQNGQVTPPGGSPVLPNANGTIKIPGADGNLGTPDDGIVTPNGNSTVNPDGSLTLPGGGTVDLPGCRLTVEPGGVVLPNGAVINPGANGVLDTPGYAPQAPGQPGNGQQTPGTRAMANNGQANQGQQDATNQPTVNNTANSNVNDDVYLDPTIVCATPVAKPQTPTGAASQVVLYATIIAAAVGAIVVIRRNRK